jgi:hypothetical protein
MKTKPLSLILTSSLLLWAALPLHASVDSMLTLVVKCYTQEKTSMDGLTEYGRVDTYRLDAKQLLKLLEKQLNVNYPNGSQLKVAVDGKVYVTDSKAKVLADVSSYLHATLDQTILLFNGNRNHTTGRENTRNYFPIALTFNLLTLQGSVNGLANEHYTSSLPNKFGIRNINGVSTSTVNGNGSFVGKLAYFDGSLKLIGRATE